MPERFPWPRKSVPVLYTIEIHIKSSSRLKMMWETAIGYKSRKCMLAVQGGLLGDHKSALVRQKHMLSPPAFSSPLINEDLSARTTAESIATLPSFGPIEGQKWFFQISSQWESQEEQVCIDIFRQNPVFTSPEAVQHEREISNARG